MTSSILALVGAAVVLAGAGRAARQVEGAAPAAEAGPVAVTPLDPTRVDVAGSASACGSRISRPPSIA
jgi:hypothetical protein